MALRQNGSRPVPVPNDRRRVQQERQAVLLDAARAGDRDSLNELVADLTPLLWHVVRAQGLDEELAADVVQTTWLRLLGNLHKIETPPELAGWLITVATREAWHAYKAYRAGAMGDDTVLVDLPDATEGPDEQLISAERKSLLWTVFRRLDERCQLMLRMIAFSRSPDYKAVGVKLRMPIGSIGPTRRRCLDKLRDLLAAEPSWSRT